MLPKWFRAPKLLKTARLSTHRRERPLAWAQLSHQKVRLAVAMGGIGFANVLIFMQLGFLNLFNGGATLLPQSLKGDLFLLNPSSEFLGSSGFDRIRLYQAAGVAGVKDTIPVLMSVSVPWGYTKEFKSFEGRVYAFSPAKTVFDIPEVEQQQRQLGTLNSILFDQRAKPQFGPIAQEFARKGSLQALVNNRRTEVVGLFELGNSFFIGGGNILMSEDTYAEIMGANALAQVGVGIVLLEPGADPLAVQATINKRVPGVQAYTHDELIAKELKFQESTAVGPIFGFGVIMGFIVGVVVVYQVLYADVSDHLAEYATLKAMGYSDLRLLLVIFQEAALLAVLGFIPGLGISLWMYSFLGGLTRLELVMTPDTAVLVFVLTLGMCLISAAIASGKLRAADPADVF
jgi:putative ABC transport system permease protein